MKQAGGVGHGTTPLCGQCSYNNDCGSCITTRFEAELPLHSKMLILFFFKSIQTCTLQGPDLKAIKQK